MFTNYCILVVRVWKLWRIRCSILGMSMQTLIALLFEIVEVCRKVPLMGLFRFLVFSPVMCVVVVLFLEKRRKNDGKSRCRHSEIGSAGVSLWD